MRKYLALVAFLAASPIAAASAADMPLKAPPMPYAPAYSWTGFYIGGELGGGWATEQTTVVTQLTPGAAFPPGTVLSPENLSGFLGGGYAGYNYQFNQIVIGIEGNYDGADLTGSGRDTSPVPGNGSVSSHSVDMRWDASVTGRLGYAVNNWLLYGKGGWAWAGFHDTTTTVNGLGVPSSTGTGSDERDGWTLGAGVEYGFLPHWSAKLEYDYVKFDTSNHSPTQSILAGPAAGTVGAVARSTTSDLNIFKGGIAYRF